MAEYWWLITIKTGTLGCFFLLSSNNPTNLNGTFLNHFFYNIFIYVFELVIWAFAFFNQKARFFIDGRKVVNAQLSVLSYSKFKKRVWIHAASLGEFEQARPIIEELRESSDDLGIIVTFFSPSGLEVMKDYRHADMVLYLPMDTPKKAREFVELLKPDIAVFIKYEFWYNYMKICLDKGVTFIYVSAIFRKDQIYFNRAKPLYLPVFKRIDKFFVQDAESFDILQAINVSQAVICGDTRLDRVLAVSKAPFEDKSVLKFCNDHDVIVFGSVWPSDFPIVNEVISKFSKDFRIIIAPHNIDEKSLKELKESFDKDAIMHSTMSEESLNSSQVMIIDSIGLLSKLYRFGKYNYVGGAFNGGLHNILEPAVYGKPVFFGNHESNLKFKEVTDLQQAGGAIAVDSGDDICQWISNFEKDEQLFQSYGKAANNYIESNKGATEQVVRYLQSII